MLATTINDAGRLATWHVLRATTVKNDIARPLSRNYVYNRDNDDYLSALIINVSVISSLLSYGPFLPHNLFL